MKAEAIRKTCIVTVNKATCTEQDNGIHAKPELDSHERMLHERVQRAEIQILNMEHEKKKQEVQDLLDKGTYTYEIFDMDLNISPPEKEWLKGQRDNYQDRAQQHLQTLNDIVEHQKHAIESSQTLDDIPDVKMPSFEPFTVLCQVSAGSPSDLHFVVAPPCQSSHSISIPNSGSQTTQGSSLKVHSPQLPPDAPATVYGNNSESTRNKRTPIVTNSDSQNDQGSSLKRHTNQPSNMVNEGSSLKRHENQPSNSATTVSGMVTGMRNRRRNSRRLPGKTPEAMQGDPSVQAAACSQVQGMKSVPKGNNMEYLQDNKKYVELQSSNELQSRLQSAMRISSRSNGVHPKINTSSNLPDSDLHVQGDKLAETIAQRSSELQDPESADLDFLLESCWQLASSLPSNLASSLPSNLASLLPSNNSNVSQSGLGNQAKVDDRRTVLAPVGLTLPTEISYDVLHKDMLSSKGKKYSNGHKERLAVSEITMTTINQNASYSTPVTSTKQNDVGASITQDLSQKQVSDNICDSSNETNMSTKVDISYLDSETNISKQVSDNSHSSETSVPKKVVTSYLGRSDIIISKKVDIGFPSSSEMNLPKEEGSSSHSNSETDIPKVINLDISTATSSDTGIVDCSAISSEPGDPKTLEPDCEEEVPDEKLYMMSDDEVITVETSLYKMNERKYLYQHDSREFDNLDSSWWDEWSQDISQQSGEGTHLEEDVNYEKGCMESNKMEEVKENNERLCALFLPAYLTGESTSPPDVALEDDDDNEAHESNFFLPEWMKKSKTAFL
ncbi:uncharacterized protein [Amphiura filiformis]|uniref:uncharacterized protein n=1 Tax=Amphiura filiformis TaxID=82378 RepID=UPI003B213CCB